MNVRKTDDCRLRYERYVALAALPVAGLSAHTVAEIIHYGGPTIQIERTHYVSSTHLGVHHAYSYGVSSGALRSNAGSATAAGRNVAAGVWMSSDFAFAGAAVRMGRMSDLGFGSVEFAIEGSASVGQVGGVAGQILGGELSSFCNLLQLFDEGDAIGSAGSDFSASAAVAMSAFGHASIFGHTIAHHSFAAGGWTALDGEESRGYAGFELAIDGTDAFGWVDLGWDGDVLTIYDWAYNTDGAIDAGNQGGSTPVPGGVGLAALALGAAGMRRRRKRLA